LHAKQRRTLALGFSDAALRSYEDVIYSHAKSFCSRLQGYEPGNKEWSSTQNMAHWCRYLAFDMMLDITYGAKMDMVDKPDNRSLLKAILISNKRVAVLIALPSLKGTYLDLLIFKSAIKARYAFIGFVKKMIIDKSTTDPPETQGRRCIYDILINARKGKEFSQTEIAAESTNLITAGFDTTATVVAACFFYLSRYREAYERAAHEVRDTFPSGSEIKSRTKINTCTYLRACITESMRMAPAVASSPFREVEPGGVEVDGKYIPPGCDVGVGIYAVHHNPRYFPQPFTFRPERWIVGAEQEGLSTADQVHTANSAFLTFGKGSRTCIGKGLAFMESMSIMAMILCTFDFKMAEGKEGGCGEGVPGTEYGRHRVKEYQIYDHVTAVNDGPILQFRTRAEVRNQDQIV